MGKLKNIKAINEMLRGQHRSQTKATTGFENKKTERVIGEVWTDDNGQKWVQKDGYKSKVSRFDKIRKLITADKCPCCNKKITNFDKQFIKRENKCHDCITKEQTMMICEGYQKGEDIYGEWERNKIKKNVESFLSEASQEVELIKKTFTQMEYVNSDGKVEKWKLPESSEDINKNIDDRFNKFKNELLLKAKYGKDYKLKSEEKNDNVKNTTTK